MLHDPQKIPEPILVISGLTYLLPFYMAIHHKRTYDATTYLFLTFTTVGFHSTRSETLFSLDCIAILNFLIRNYYLSRQTHSRTQAVFFLSVIYSLVSYFVGKYYSIMSFDPNWNTQMFFHSIMHLSTSYASFVIMDDPRLNIEL